MSQYVETPTRADTAAGAIAQYLRVKTPGAVAVAGASDVSIGTMEYPCLAAGPCTVRLRSAQGTRKMVCSEAITAGNSVYAAASGKIAASGTVLEGVAMETSTANNDVIEVLPIVNVDLVAAGGITLPTVTFNGATGANEIVVPTNLADALSVEDSAGDLVVVTTTTGSQSITITPATTVTGVLTSAGGITLSGAVDLTFSGTTGQPEIVLTDNLADALSIKGTHGDMIVFTTTDSAEAIALTARTTITDGVASGTAKRIGGLAYCLAAAGTAHTNSTDEAVLASYELPANTIKAGTVVKIRYQGIATVQAGATTLTVNLRIGPTTLTGTVVQTHPSHAVTANDIFEGEFTLVGRAAPGAAAACVGVGNFGPTADAYDADLTLARISNIMASTNFATNGALKIELCADWSAADASSCRADIFIVEVI